MAKDAKGLVSNGEGTFRERAGKFLGRLPEGLAVKDGENDGGDASETGSGDGADDARTIDPAKVAPAAPKRRGGKKWSDERKAAARARHAAKKEGVAVDEPEPQEFEPTLVGQMAMWIGGIHQMIAVGMQSPELQLTPQESEMLAKALANVGKYYVAVKLSGPNQAWFALIVTAGGIYVPRILTIRNRKMQGGVSRETPSPPLGEADPSTSSGPGVAFADYEPPLQ
jgi:hypothetical protein